MNDFRDTEGELGFAQPVDRSRQCVRCGRVGHLSAGCTWPVSLPPAPPSQPTVPASRAPFLWQGGKP
jgi:hypothetical protein